MKRHDLKKHLQAYLETTCGSCEVQEALVGSLAHRHTMESTMGYNVIFLGKTLHFRLKPIVALRTSVRILSSKLSVV